MSDTSEREEPPARRDAGAAVTENDASGSHVAADRRAPPRVDGWPLVGNTVQFMQDPFAFYERAAERGDVVAVDIFGDEGCLVFDPAVIRRILVDEHYRYRKGDVLQEAADELFPEGLVATEGDQWRRQRSLVQPAFYREAVESYADDVVDLAADRADGWRDGATVRMDAELKQFTLSVLGRALFDRELREDDPVRRAANAIADRMDVRSVSRLLPSWVPTPANRRFRRAMADFDALIDELIAARERDPSGDDLLSFLVAAGDDADGLTESALRDQLVTFLFAGHETSSLALTYALLLLAAHPAEQARLHDEVAALDGDPTAADLPALDRTERVVREAMRLYPPVFTVFREPTEPETLGGYDVPAGTTLSMPQWVVHRDERWWDDPETFDPDRWTDEPAPEYSYFPFGGGPRACIGSRFAMLELRLALATMARRVRVGLAPGQSAEPALRMAVTLQPADPVELTVTTR